MIVGGDLGSARKMWWISGLFEYRSGGDGTAGGALWSGWMLRSKVCRLNGVDEPKDASNDGSFERFTACQELVWQVLLYL